MLNSLQRDVLLLLGPVFESHGFALGGGAALLAHQVIDRKTNDLDNYAQSDDPVVYENVERAVMDALAHAGYAATVSRRLDWFRQIDILDPDDPDSVILTIDAGINTRTITPVRVAGYGLVLALDDVKAGKLDALIARSAARDFRDVDALIQGRYWSVPEIREYVQWQHPDLSLSEVADRFRLVSRVEPGDLTRAGASPDEIPALIRRFGRYADQILATSSDPLDSEPTSRFLDLTPSQDDPCPEPPVMRGREVGD